MSNIPQISIQQNEKLTRIFEIIKTIEDPRRTSFHPFESIIMIMICASLGGSNDAISIAEFGKNHIDWFKKIIKLPYGMPSHDTFTRMINKIHPEEMKKILSIRGEIQLQNLIENEDSQEVSVISKHISLDGKMLRALSEYSPLTLVRAYFAHQKQTLAQVKVGHGTNEITTIPKVLNCLKSFILGAIITIDAIGTQRKIVKQIIELQADYVLPVKGNQHQLYADLKLFLDDLADGKMPHTSFTYHETIDKKSGRIERRKCWTTGRFKWLHNKGRWKGLKSISIVETEIAKGKCTTITRRYYISSLLIHAKLILAIVRNHWGIENKLHWPLNVAFREHVSTIRKGRGAENFSILRCLSLSLLQNNSATLSVVNKRARAACSFEYLLELLTGEKNHPSTTKSYSQKLTEFINYGIGLLVKGAYLSRFV